MCQLAEAQKTKPKRGLSSDTDPNLRQVMTIKLISGRDLVKAPHKLKIHEARLEKF